VTPGDKPVLHVLHIHDRVAARVIVVSLFSGYRCLGGSTEVTSF
jgi:hypothetical protein